MALTDGALRWEAYLWVPAGAGAALGGLSVSSGSNLRYKDCFLRADCLN